MSPALLFLLASIEILVIVYLCFSHMLRSFPQLPRASQAAQLLLPAAELVLLVYVAARSSQTDYFKACCIVCMVACGLAFWANSKLFGYICEFEKGRSDRAQEQADHDSLERIRTEKAALVQEHESIVAYKERMGTALSQARLLMQSGASREQLENCLSAVVAVSDDVSRIACEHPELNAVLQVKARRCEELSVSFLTRVDVSADCSIPAQDLCRVFYNLIDNAVRSTAQLPVGRRYVQVRAAEERGFLIIRVENSCLPDGSEQPLVEAEDNQPVILFVEDKAESAPLKEEPALESAERLLREHGWGLQIVSDIAEAHGGALSTQQRDAVFEASVVMKA